MHAKTPPAFRGNALKAWYALFFGAQCTQLFLPLILARSMHFSPTTVGALLGARRLVTMLIAPLFTFLCDSTRRHRLFLISAHTVYYLCSLALALVTPSLRTVLPILLLRETAIAGCEPAVDNAAVAALSDAHAPAGGYGQLRRWGSLGWGLSSVAAAAAVDNLFHGDLLAVLYMQAALGIPVILVVATGLDLSPALFARQTARQQARNTNTLGTATTSAALRVIARSPRARFCALTVLSQGVVFGVLQLTTFLYFSDLGISTQALGFSVLVSCAAEAAVFSFDRRIWRAAGGPQGAFNLGLAMSAVALLLYAAVQFAPAPTPAFVATEFFNGGVYALFFTSALAITAQMAPADLTTTAQGALSAVYSGVGPAIGAAFAGVGYELVGAPAMYCALAAVQVVILAVPLALGVDISSDGPVDRPVPLHTVRENTGGEDKVPLRAAADYCGDSSSQGSLGSGDGVLLMDETRPLLG